MNADKQISYRLVCRYGLFHGRIGLAYVFILFAGIAAMIKAPILSAISAWLYILVFVPAGWLILYALAGTYHSLYKKSRLAEFTSHLSAA